MHKVDRFSFNNCATYTKGIGKMVDNNDNDDDDDIEYKMEKRTHDKREPVLDDVCLPGWLAVVKYLCCFVYP